MEALTIEQLNSFENSFDQKEYEAEKLQKNIESCLNDVADKLKMQWHNKSDKWHYCYGYFNWDSEAFLIVRDMYEKNRIEISYYAPNNIFSFRLI